MSCTAKYALVLSIEGIDVTRTTEVFRLACGVGKSADGGSAVVRADACRATLQQIDCHGERRAEHAGVVCHLMVEFEFCGALHGDGCTEHATSVAQHEVDLLGGYHFGCRDEVAFVLAVLIIHDDDALSLAEVIERRFDGA